MAEVESLRAQLAAEQTGHLAELERLRTRLAVEQELTEQKGAEWQRQVQQLEVEKAETLGKVRGSPKGTRDFCGERCRRPRSITLSAPCDCEWI